MISGCASIKREAVIEPVDSFTVCYSHGCQTVQTVRLNKEQWLVIDQIFAPKSATPEQERKQISLAIAQMEMFIGELTQTKNDLPGTFEALFTGFGNQMDCVDEATNTTLYLKLFRHRGLIHYHREDHRINRGFFFNGWPHTSAVIEESESGK